MAPFRTIVGGRAFGGEPQAHFPRGIELLLKKAKADPEFRALFLTDPVAAARSLGLPLAGIEARILESMPKEALETAVEHTRLAKQHVPLVRASRTAAALMAALTFAVVMPPEVAAAGEHEELYMFQDSKRIAAEKLAVVQKALKDYVKAFGEYPSTLQWVLDDSPLGDLLPKVAIHDPWYRRFHYEGLVADGRILNYRLESLGADLDSSEDNIRCPIDPDLHSFVVPNPVTILSPRNGDSITAGGPAAVKRIEVNAAHAVGDAEIMWLLDKKAIRTTRRDHRFDLLVVVGPHELVARDAQGNTDFAVFAVRSKGAE